ncbi:hypothetical protein TNIN_445881 [Trichonephila inaurata madagascariensis]|uniref:Zinc-finger CCCH domain-containing protein n=1 Tax=Trichonephila inaurata madagascariensis TaxID=2747483 RepID=A0A8X6XEJ0_9ARAC|nr:hypothetical protein TNIN_445881 [Trichonephila inaurata madagascariensis]
MFGKNLKPRSPISDNLVVVVSTSQVGTIIKINEHTFSLLCNEDKYQYRHCEQVKGTQIVGPLFQEKCFDVSCKFCHMIDKVNKCQYRHCTAAKARDIVCPLWPRKLCKNPSCSFRHRNIKNQ